MKKLTGAVVLLLLSSLAALAAEAEGEIKTIDRETLVITLEDGKSYKLPAEIDLSGISEGMTILLAYEKIGDQNQITDMQLSE